MKIRQISPECGLGMCPAVFAVASECALGACPTIFQISPDCGIGACPTAFVAGDDLIVVGAVLTAEETQAVAHKIKAGEETAVRVPKSLIARLKF
jgi:hypothetical protein